MTGYKFLDLPSCGCRWPLADGLFCGEPQKPGNRQPYCEAHAEMNRGYGSPSERAAAPLPRDMRYIRRRQFEHK